LQGGERASARIQAREGLQFAHRPLDEPDVRGGGELVAEADEDRRAARRRSAQQQLVHER
jgi:hypothetical protein